MAVEFLFFNILHIVLVYVLSDRPGDRNSSVSIFLGGNSRYHKKQERESKRKLVNRGCLIKSAPSVGN